MTTAPQSIPYLRLDTAEVKQLVAAAIYLNALRRPVYVPMDLIDKLTEQITRQENKLAFREHGLDAELK